VAPAGVHRGAGGVGGGGGGGGGDGVGLGQRLVLRVCQRTLLLLALLLHLMLHGGVLVLVLQLLLQGLLLLLLLLLVVELVLVVDAGDEVSVLHAVEDVGRGRRRELSGGRRRGRRSQGFAPHGRTLAAAVSARPVSRRADPAPSPAAVAARYRRHLCRRDLRRLRGLRCRLVRRGQLLLCTVLL